MNAYLFTGLVTHYCDGRYVDGCQSFIIYGGDEEASWKAFERILLWPHAERGSVPAKIERVVGAPVLDRLLTEGGHTPIDWPELVEEVLRVLESTPLTDQEEGYWLDCERLVGPDNLAGDPRQLQHDLPQNIRSALNWSPDKACFFLLTVLSPSVAGADSGEIEGRHALGDEALARAEDITGSEETGCLLAQHLATFPQLADMELAVVLRAPNSAVATWLWRRFASATPLARHAIRIDALCDIVPIAKVSSERNDD